MNMEQPTFNSEGEVDEELIKAGQEKVQSDIDKSRAKTEQAIETGENELERKIRESQARVAQKLEDAKVKLPDLESQEEEK